MTKGIGLPSLYTLDRQLATGFCFCPNQGNLRGTATSARTCHHRRESESGECLQRGHPGSKTTEGLCVSGSSTETKLYTSVCICMHTCVYVHSCVYIWCVSLCTCVCKMETHFFLLPRSLGILSWVLAGVAQN